MGDKPKVFCVGDGYAHGHIWPEWPQILKALRQDLDVTIISGIGAGHEFLISELLTHDISNSLIIFQWPLHARFDKLVQNSNWIDIIASDPIYHFNTYNTSNGTWWCSSASKLEAIKHYHKFYVEQNQSKLRQQNQKTLLSAYLTQQNSQYIFTSNEDQEEFIKQYDCRGTEIQPLPLSHYYWLTKSIMPAVNLAVDQHVAEQLFEKISAHNWIPYDPDREEIWANMLKLSN